MNRPATIHLPAPRNPHRAAALLVSCVFHALLIGVVVLALLRHHRERPPISSGSPESTPTLTLSKLVITSTPRATPPTPSAPEKVPPTKPQPPAHPAEAKIERKEIPVAGAPVLAAPKMETQASSPREHHLKRPHHHPAPEAEAASALAAVPAAMPSSYAAGENLFPHPPYPEEARFLRETGTVVVTVRFDAGGDVAQVEVTRSSGVPDLDVATRSFIRSNWHSVPYAGATLSVPVEYTLEN